MVIQKNETRIKKIYLQKLELLNFEKHRNKRNAMYIIISSMLNVRWILDLFVAITHVEENRVCKKQWTWEC